MGDKRQARREGEMRRGQRGRVAGAFKERGREQKVRVAVAFEERWGDEEERREAC